MSCPTNVKEYAKYLYDYGIKNHMVDHIYDKENKRLTMITNHIDIPPLVWSGITLTTYAYFLNCLFKEETEDNYVEKNIVKWREDKFDKCSKAFVNDGNICIGYYKRYSIFGIKRYKILRCCDKSFIGEVFKNEDNAKNIIETEFSKYRFVSREK